MKPVAKRADIIDKIGSVQASAVLSLTSSSFEPREFLGKRNYNVLSIDLFVSIFAR